jgi:hypothetical protein
MTQPGQIELRLEDELAEIEREIENEIEKLTRELAEQERRRGERNLRLPNRVRRR